MTQSDLMQSAQDPHHLDAVDFLNLDVLSHYINSLPTLTISALAFGIFIFTAIFLIFYRRRERDGRLHKVICRTEINWGELTCIHHKGDQVFMFNMADATQIHVKLITTRQLVVGRRRNRVQYRYRGIISLRGRSESGDEISSTFLADTGEHRSNERVYHSSMRFAAIFAERLNVELSYQEELIYLR